MLRLHKHKTTFPALNQRLHRHRKGCPVRFFIRTGSPDGFLLLRIIVVRAITEYPLQKIIFTPPLYAEFAAIQVD
jgi:hypothetical protein